VKIRAGAGHGGLALLPLTGEVCDALRAGGVGQ